MTTFAYKKTVSATWLTGLAAAFIMPDVIFGVLLELTHLMLETAHLLFELLESALDHMVEHLFHTETRETQIIVFYLLVTMGLAGFYYLWRKVKQFFCTLINTAQSTCLDTKYRFLSYWSESAHNKFKLIAGVNVALTFIYLAGF
jgi:hypothetical protein